MNSIQDENGRYYKYKESREPLQNLLKDAGAHIFKPQVRFHYTVTNRKIDEKVDAISLCLQ